MMRYLFEPQSEFYFFKNWDDIPEALLKKLIPVCTPVFFNTSYFFASESLDEDKLANFVNRFVKNYSSSNIFFIFQNSSVIDRNTKYNNFKNKIDFKTYANSTEPVYYKTNPDNEKEPGSEMVYYEILTLV
ncbi:MAG: hypothetical protein GY749_24880 [Desulfobacteraceae bacterium]|nr:hypothetical protein [Desulfobacteraceae bacterium]